MLTFQRLRERQAETQDLKEDIESVETLEQEVENSETSEDLEQEVENEPSPIPAPKSQTKRRG